MGDMADWINEGDPLDEQLADEIDMEVMVLMERRDRLIARLNYAERFRPSDTTDIRRMADELEVLDGDIESLEQRDGSYWGLSDEE